MDFQRFEVEEVPAPKPVDASPKPAKPCCPIETFPKLISLIDDQFAKNLPYSDNHCAIRALLERVDMTTTELNKYVFFDLEKPYTRNLVATDGKHYTLLILCWGSGKESKIHNHPCDGCFIKTLSGCIKESRYCTDEHTDEIRQTGTKFFCEGQVSYMCDDMGLHKIGNPNLHVGAVSLHLYTPPFQTCKVWSEEGVGELSKAEIGVMGYFSAFGLRTPNREGKPGKQARVLNELLAKTELCL